MINSFKRYAEYIKDNPQGHWFKRKMYGWGWTPATREGWIVTVIFILLVLANVWRLESDFYSVSETTVFVQIAVFVAVFLVICWRTGENPSWKWGPKDKTENDFK